MENFFFCAVSTTSKALQMRFAFVKWLVEVKPVLNSGNIVIIPFYTAFGHADMLLVCLLYAPVNSLIALWISAHLCILPNQNWRADSLTPLLRVSQQLLFRDLIITSSIIKSPHSTAQYLSLLLIVWRRPSANCVYNQGCKWWTSNICWRWCLKLLT